jgi:hypothetical protein
VFGIQSGKSFASVFVAVSFVWDSQNGAGVNSSPTRAEILREVGATRAQVTQVLTNPVKQKNVNTKQFGPHDGSSDCQCEAVPMAALIYLHLIAVIRAVAVRERQVS